MLKQRSYLTKGIGLTKTIHELEAMALTIAHPDEAPPPRNQYSA